VSMVVEKKPSIKITHITHNNVKMVEDSDAWGNNKWGNYLNVC